MKNAVSDLFDAANAVLARPLLWSAAIAAVLVVQIWLIVSHQAWADEYQALIIATEAPDLSTMFAWLHYEGHPSALYLLLRSLATVTGPQNALWFTALILALLTQSIILFASPLSRAERLLVSLSEFILFEALAISRGTTLGAAMTFAIAALWRSRWSWLLIALLPQVDFLFGVISGVFLILKWRDGQLWWPGLGLWLVSGAFAAWTVIPPADMVSAHEAMDMPSGIGIWFQQMSGLMIPFQGGIRPMWNAPILPVGGFAWIGFLAVCWFATRGFHWHMLVLFGFFAFTLVFSMLIYPIGLRHLVLGALLLIVLVWLQSARGETANLAFRIWIAIAALCGLGVAAIQTVRLFDSGGGALAAIEQRGLADKHWIAFPEWRAPAVSGRSDLSFERPEQRCTYRSVLWNYKPTIMRNRERFRALLTREVAEHGRTYILSDMDYGDYLPGLVEPVARIPAGYDGIPYFIYVIGKDAPDKRVDLPECTVGDGNVRAVNAAGPLGKK